MMNNGPRSHLELVAQVVTRGDEAGDVSQSILPLSPHPGPGGDLEDEVVVLVQEQTVVRLGEAHGCRQLRDTSGSKGLGYHLRKRTGVGLGACRTTSEPPSPGGQPGYCEFLDAAEDDEHAPVFEHLSNHAVGTAELIKKLKSARWRMGDIISLPYPKEGPSELKKWIGTWFFNGNYWYKGFQKTRTSLTRARFPMDDIEGWYFALEGRHDIFQHLSPQMLNISQAEIVAMLRSRNIRSVQLPEGSVCERFQFQDHRTK